MQPVADGDHCTDETNDDKTHHRRQQLPLDHFPTINNRKESFMTSHEFDAYCDSQEFAEPYHEQIAVMHEVELDREESVRECP